MLDQLKGPEANIDYRKGICRRDTPGHDTGLDIGGTVAVNSITIISVSALRIGFATARHVGGERVSFYTLGELTKMM